MLKPRKPSLDTGSGVVTGRKAAKPPAKPAAMGAEDLEEVLETPSPAKAPGKKKKTADRADRVEAGHPVMFRPKPSDLKEARVRQAITAHAQDAFFKSVIAQARKKHGVASALLGSQTRNMVVSTPMYGGHGENAKKYPGCLPMEFAIGQDGWPLQLVAQVVGKPGVGKSALLAELGRWFAIQGGGLFLHENESKFNPQWYESILGAYFDSMPYFKCRSVEEWQSFLSDSISDTKKMMLGTAKEPGLGKIFPVVYGVDSIMGKQSEETQEGILGKKDARTGLRGKTGTGHATRGYAVEAQFITRYLRTIASEFDTWPFSLVLVNHLRIGKDDMGHDVRQKAGGVQVDFQESFELQLNKVGGPKKMIRCREFAGYPVEISCEKSSFSETHRKAPARIIWWDEEDDVAGRRQHTTWDWDWGTVALLNRLLHGEGSDPAIKASLKKMDFHLECPKTSDVENTAWSRSLDMKQTDAMPWTELGALIREDQDMMRELRTALRITRRPVFDRDFDQMLSEASTFLP